MKLPSGMVAPPAPFPAGAKIAFFNPQAVFQALYDSAGREEARARTLICAGPNSASLDGPSDCDAFAGQ